MGFAGYDIHHGYQLYMSDPSGNYSGWKATCIGQNNQAGKSLLKTDYEEGLDLDAGLKLATKVLLKTMDATAATPDKFEFAVLSADESGKCKQSVVSLETVQAILDEVNAGAMSEGDA